MFLLVVSFSLFSLSLSINKCFFLALAYPNQRCVIVPTPHFVDLRSEIPLVGILTGVYGIGSGNFRPELPHVEVLVPFNPPAVAPVGFAVNPALLIRMDEERTQSLLQVTKLAFRLV